MSRKFDYWNKKYFNIPPIKPTTSAPWASPSPKSTPSPQKEGAPVPEPVTPPSTKPVDKIEKPETTQPPPMEAKGQPESKTSAETIDMRNLVEVLVHGATEKFDQPKKAEEEEKPTADKQESPAGPSGTGKEVGQPSTENGGPTAEPSGTVKEGTPPPTESAEPAAGPSGTCKEVTPPPTSPETKEAEKAAEIKKFVEERRAMPNCPLTDEDIMEILARMECLECHRIPSPYRLFQCPRGHIFCFNCGAKRFMKEDEEGHISSGTCDQEMETVKGSGPNSTRGIGYGLINPELTLADGEIEELVKNKTTGKLECRLRIRKSVGDPVFKAMFNNTLWNCPYKKFGCEEKHYGTDIHAHLMLCMKKLGIL